MANFQQFQGDLTGAFNVANQWQATIAQQKATSAEMLAQVERFNQTRMEMDAARAKVGGILSAYGTDEKGKPDASAPKYVHDAYNAINKEGGLQQMSASQLNAVLTGYQTGVAASQQRLQDMQVQKAIRAEEDQAKIDEAFRKTQEERDKIAKDEEVVSKKEVSTTKSYDITTPEGIRNFTIDYSKAKEDARQGIGVLKKEDWQRKQPRVMGEAGWFAKSPAELISDAMAAASKQEEQKRKTEVEKAKTLAAAKVAESKLAELNARRVQQERTLSDLKSQGIATRGYDGIAEGQTLAFGDKVVKPSRRLDVAKAELEYKDAKDKYESAQSEWIRGGGGFGPKPENVNRLYVDYMAAAKRYDIAKGHEFSYQRARDLTPEEIQQFETERSSAIADAEKQLTVTTSEIEKLQSVKSGPLPQSIRKPDKKLSDVKKAELDVTEYVEQRDRILKSQESMLTDEFNIITNHLKATGSMPSNWNRSTFMQMKGYPVIQQTEIPGVGMYVSVNGKGEIIKNKDLQGDIGDQLKIRDATLLAQQRSLNGTELAAGSGYRFTGEIRSNDIKDVNKVRMEIGTTSTALSNVDTLLRIAEDASLLDKLVPGEITGVASSISNAIQAASRTEIGGSGAWSEQDQMRIDKIVRDPTAIKNIAFRQETIASIKAYKQRLTDSLNRSGAVYGFRMSGTPNDARMAEARISRLRIAYQTALASGKNQQEALLVARQALEMNQ